MRSPYLVITLAFAAGGVAQGQTASTQLGAVAPPPTIAQAMAPPSPMIPPPPPPVPTTGVQLVPTTTATATPQLAAAPGAPAAPQTVLLLLQHAAPAVPTAPSVLVSNPPPWDRALAQVGQWLTERSMKHQHGKPMQLTVATPAAAQVTVATQPAIMPLVPVMAVPAGPSPQSVVTIPAQPVKESLFARMFKH
jgi:hypothetical protein